MCCPAWARPKKVHSATATTFVRLAYRLLWRRQMDYIKQSVSWWCFTQRGMTIERMVRIATDIGYEASNWWNKSIGNSSKIMGWRSLLCKGSRRLKRGLIDESTMIASNERFVPT